MRSSRGRRRRPARSPHLVRGPCAITRPSFITITRSPARMTKSRSCSTIRSVMPVAPHREDVLEQLDAQRRAHAGHRLVEEQDARLDHQRAHEVEQLALSARERAGERARTTAARRARAARALRARSRSCVRERAGATRPAEPLAGWPAPRASRSRAPSSASAPAASGTCARGRPARSGAPVAGRSACRRTRRDRTRAGRNPEIAKSVDLPAPFGPIRPVIEPRSTSNVAPSTARTPPNARTTFSTSSSALTRAPSPAPAENPLRPQHDEPDDHEPITISRR